MFKVTKSCTPIDNCRLDRFFVNFPRLKDSFMEGCRSFIGLNGCHLKEPFEGVLLFVVTLDSNQGIFPLVVSVCEFKNTENWTWFLGHLKEYFNDSRQLTFKTNKQKGVLNALN